MCSGFLAELLLPVGFMGLLILIKSITTIYDSPNVAYFCGNTYPWFYADSFDWFDPSSWKSSIPFTCTQKPRTCSAKSYYQDSITESGEIFYSDPYNVSAYQQYGKATTIHHIDDIYVLLYEM